MTAIYALAAFIAVIIVWNSVFKRNIAEAMVVGFMACCAFAGTGFLPLLVDSLWAGMQNEVTFAALAFVIVADILTRAGIVQRIVDIFGSLLGRRRGGSLYAATVGSGVFGAVAHNGAATAATIGAITIPWIKRSKASGETAAIVLGGNAGVGAVFPFSGAYFLLLAAPTVMGKLDAEGMVLTMFVAALWMVAIRIVIAAVMIRRRDVGAMDPEDVKPLRDTFSRGWSSLLVLAAVAIPIVATSGTLVTSIVGAEAADAVPVLVWLPVALLLPGLVVGRKSLPRTGRAWWSLLGDSSPKLGVVGVTMVAAFSASEAVSSLGLSEQLTPLLQGLGHLPAWLVAVIVGVVVIVVAGPLSTTATIAAVGGVAFAALTAVGVPEYAAFAALLVWGASESASPPGAAPLYVAAGIANVDPVRTFMPVIGYYLIPTFLLGVLMAVGVAWVP
ncbi:TRAP transporter large permease subunit [Stackebrandtia nassauensis]|uniref:TRAP C4-dicarboxylate transport system permease DctM subunit n=1 Tax=Stackebrandtia nassauensis (strain DSM 44728 / CIP 108903 / NRRL B-16338 / NBRC 102104 / LLR-40K-21) TaxID=446470 RepID=D3PW96_STANL|nr:TRAP transporter large permease subunit [Stackebrandtia nassauensis]ADD41253.1 TRAP C4-dicarboxylate transport system permease DctM subunit [Stackebrandtia nassauensis DSM 44728]